MSGPVSNMVGNEAKIPVGYTAIAEMPRWAAAYCRHHDGETVPMKMLGFFCVLLRREVYERVGEMDERFGVGFFEDTDYCYRAARPATNCAAPATPSSITGTGLRSACWGTTAMPKSTSKTNACSNRSGAPTAWRGPISNRTPHAPREVDRRGRDLTRSVTSTEYSRQA